jgi:hypothetical protein
MGVADDPEAQEKARKLAGFAGGSALQMRARKPSGGSPPAHTPQVAAGFGVVEASRFFGEGRMGAARPAEAGASKRRGRAWEDPVSIPRRGGSAVPGRRETSVRLVNPP